MKTLKQVEQLTGIKSDNLRQRIARGTLKATKIGRDWFVREKEAIRISPPTESIYCQSYYGDDNKLHDCTCGKCT